MFQTDFTIEELKQRREKVCDAIGEGALALLQGADTPPSHGLFRQYNDVYYLSGVEEPHAYLLLNGRSRKATLFLAHQKDDEGEVLSPDRPDRAKELTGVDAVRGIEDLASHIHNAPVVYTPFRHGEGFNESRDNLWHWYANVVSDPWDGRLGRTAHFIRSIKERYPQIEIRNLSPVMENLRLIKSAREQDLLRRAGQLSAYGVREAMRSTRPGVMEYQIDACMRYVYLNGGARDQGYRAIIAGGPNVWYAHYKQNDRDLKDGEWVLVDCAPDYRYYTSDIGRMWPVNGTYSSLQRELYGFVVVYHKAVLKQIRSGATAPEIHAAAANEMRGVLEKWTFSKPIYEAAARRMLDFTGHLSHGVGMCVHDPVDYRPKPLAPGTVFAVDPQMWIPEERLYVRVEDTVCVTENGIENYTQAAPLELDEVERFMRSGGMLQAFPPVPIPTA